MTIWPCAGSVSESSHHPTDRKQEPLITGSISHQQTVGHTAPSRHAFTPVCCKTILCVLQYMVRTMWTLASTSFALILFQWFWLDLLVSIKNLLKGAVHQFSTSIQFTHDGEYYSAWDDVTGVILETTHFQWKACIRHYCPETQTLRFGGTVVSFLSLS